MRNSLGNGRRVAIIAGGLFLGSLFTACDSLTAPQQSIADQIEAENEVAMENVEAAVVETDYLRPIDKEIKE